MWTKYVELRYKDHIFNFCLSDSLRNREDSSNRTVNIDALYCLPETGEAASFDVDGKIRKKDRRPLWAVKYKASDLQQGI